jgi:hypothetical protein
MRGKFEGFEGGIARLSSGGLGPVALSIWRWILEALTDPSGPPRFVHQVSACAKGFRSAIASLSRNVGGEASILAPAADFETRAHPVEHPAALRSSSLLWAFHTWLFKLVSGFHPSPIGSLVETISIRSFYRRAIRTR